MSYPATTTLELLTVVTWACLNGPAHKAVLFTQILTSQAVLSEIVSAAGFSFCPGFFDAIQSASPPAISLFDNLPCDIKKAWGVYAVILNFMESG